MQARTEPHVIALCGSLRDDSRTRIAIEEVLASARERGAGTRLVDLRTHELPALNAVDADETDADQLREAVGAADSVLLGTPNYHGSYAGSLKNALDYCGRDEFEGTTVGLLKVAAGEFPGTALVHLRTVSRTLRAWTVPTEVAIPRAHTTVTDGGIEDDALADRARRLGRELVEYAGVSQYPEVTGAKPGAPDSNSVANRQ